VQEVFGFIKRNVSEAQRRKSAASGEGCRGKYGSPVPASAHSEPERDWRSGSSGVRGSTELGVDFPGFVHLNQQL
jgi:hypothetical protein